MNFFLFFFSESLVHLKPGSWSLKHVRSTSSWVWRRCPLYKHPFPGSRVWPRIPLTYTWSRTTSGSMDIWAVQILGQKADAPEHLPYMTSALSPAFPPSQSLVKHKDSEVSNSSTNPVSPLSTWANPVCLSFLICKMGGI